MFDSYLTECGPPAIISDEGVVLFYNGKNAEDENAAAEIPKGMYTLLHEITGQYESGTTFAEGLVYYKS